METQAHCEMCSTPHPTSQPNPCKCNTISRNESESSLSNICTHTSYEQKYTTLRVN